MDEKNDEYASVEFAEPANFADSEAKPVEVAAVVESNNEPLSKNNQTLATVAWAFTIVSLVATCWLIIPLAWMIPFLLKTNKIRKGEERPTMAFGILSLIFCNVFSGICLLIMDNKEE